MKRPSDLLEEITEAPDGGEITMGNFVGLFGDRSFALIILILALPNALPLPGIPGLSLVTGLPIFFMALQILWGRKAIWLPRNVAARRFQHKRLTKTIHKALPLVLWVEKFLRPRLTVLCESAGEKTIGLFIAAMAFILAMPIAGTNFLSGFSICLLALALLEKDGVLAILSILFSLSSFYLMYKIIILVGGGILDWLSGWM